MSTLKATNLQHKDSTDPNVVLYADGSTSIRNLQNLAPSMIINGAMQVWQRSTNTGVTGYTSVDRFASGRTGGDVNNEKIDLTGGDPFTEGFRTAYRMTNTTPETSSGSTYRTFTQHLEGLNINASGWNWASADGKITLSFWVRSSVTQDFMCYLSEENGAAKTFPVPFSCTANQWTKVEKTIPGDTGLSFPNTNTREMSVVWAPYWGSDYTTAAGPALDQWNNWDGGNRAKDYGNGAGTWGGTTNATFDITGVQLTATDAPIEFQHEDYGTTLVKCQRYFQKVSLDWRVPYWHGYDQNTARSRSTTMLPVVMRAGPTFSSTYFAGLSDGGSPINNREPVFGGNSMQAVTLVKTTDGSQPGAGFSGAYRVDFNCDAEL